MKRHMRAALALGVIAALLLFVAGCGGSGGNGGAGSNWDQLVWDQGNWQ